MDTSYVPANVIFDAIELDWTVIANEEFSKYFNQQIRERFGGSYDLLLKYLQDTENSINTQLIVYSNNYKKQSDDFNYQFVNNQINPDISTIYKQFKDDLTVLTVSNSMLLDLLTTNIEHYSDLYGYDKIYGKAILAAFVSLTNAQKDVYITTEVLRRLRLEIGGISGTIKNLANAKSENERADLETGFKYARVSEQYLERKYYTSDKLTESTFPLFVNGMVAFDYTPETITQRDNISIRFIQWIYEDNFLNNNRELLLSNNFVDITAEFYVRGDEQNLQFKKDVSLLLLILLRLQQLVREGRDRIIHSTKWIKNLCWLIDRCSRLLTRINTKNVTTSAEYINIKNKNLHSIFMLMIFDIFIRLQCTIPEKSFLKFPAAFDIFLNVMNGSVYFRSEQILALSSQTTQFTGVILQVMANLVNIIPLISDLIPFDNFGDVSWHQHLYKFVLVDFLITREFRQNTYKFVSCLNIIDMLYDNFTRNIHRLTGFSSNPYLDNHKYLVDQFGSYSLKWNGSIDENKPHEFQIHVEDTTINVSDIGFHILHHRPASTADVIDNPFGILDTNRIHPLAMKKILQTTDFRPKASFIAEPLHIISSQQENESVIEFNKLVAKLCGVNEIDLLDNDKYFTKLFGDNAYNGIATKISSLLDISGFILTPYSVPLTKVDGIVKIDEIVLERARSSFSMENFPYNCIPAGMSHFIPNSAFSCRTDGCLTVSFPMPDLPASMGGVRQENVMKEAFMELISPEQNLIFWILWLVPTNLRDDPLPVRTININDLVKYQKKNVKMVVEPKQFIDIKIHLSFYEIVRSYMYTQNIKGSKPKTLIIPQQEIINSFMTTNIPHDVDTASDNNAQPIENMSGFDFVPKITSEADIKSAAKDALYLVTRRSFWYNTLKMAHFPMIPNAYMKIVSDLSTKEDCYSIKLLAQKLLVRFDTKRYKTLYEEKSKHMKYMSSTLERITSEDEIGRNALDELKLSVIEQGLPESDAIAVQNEVQEIEKIMEEYNQDIPHVQKFLESYDEQVMNNLLPYPKDFNFAYPGPFSTQVTLSYSSNLAGNECAFVKKIFSTQETRPYNMDILDSIFIALMSGHILGTTPFGILMTSSKKHMLYEIDSYFNNKYTPEVLKLMNTGERYLSMFKYISMIQLFKHLGNAEYGKYLHKMAMHTYTQNRRNKPVRYGGGFLIYKQELEVLSPISYFVEAILHKRAHPLEINYDIETDSDQPPSLVTYTDEFMRDTIFISSQLTTFLEPVSEIDLKDDDLISQYHANSSDMIHDLCSFGFKKIETLLPSKITGDKFSMFPAKRFFGFHSSEQDVNTSTSSKRKNRLCLGTHTYYYEILQKMGAILAKSHNLIRDNIFSFIDSEDGFFVPPYLKIPKRRGVDFYDEKTVESIKKGVDPTHQYKFDHAKVPNADFFTNDTDQDPLLHVSESVYPVFPICKDDVAQSRVFYSGSENKDFTHLPSHERDFYQEREIVSKCSGFYETWYQFKTKGLTGNLGKLAVWKSIKKKRSRSYILNFMDDNIDTSVMDISNPDTVSQGGEDMDVDVHNDNPNQQVLPGKLTKQEPRTSKVVKKSKDKYEQKSKAGGKKRPRLDIGEEEDIDNRKRNKTSSGVADSTISIDDSQARILAIESVQTTLSSKDAVFNPFRKHLPETLFSPDPNISEKFIRKSVVLGDYSKQPFDHDDLIRVLDKFVSAKLLPDDFESTRIKGKQPFTYINDDSLFKLIPNVTQMINAFSKSTVQLLEVPTKDFYKNAKSMDLSEFKHLWITDQIINSFMAIIVQMIETLVYTPSASKLKAITTLDSNVTAKNAIDLIAQSRSVAFTQHLLHLGEEDYAIILCPYNKGGNHWVLVVLIVTHVESDVDRQFNYEVDAYMYDSLVPHAFQTIPKETVSEERKYYELNDEKIWDSIKETSLKNTYEEDPHFLFHEQSNEIIWDIIGILKRHLDADIKDFNEYYASLANDNPVTFTYNISQVKYHASVSLSPQQDGLFDCGIFTMVNAVMVAYKHARFMMKDDNLSDIQDCKLNMFMSNCRISRLSTIRATRRFFFADKVVQYYRYLLQVFFIDVLYNVENRVSNRIITKDEFLHYSMSKVIKQHSLTLLERENVHNFDTLLLDFSNKDTKDNILFIRYFQNLQSGKERNKNVENESTDDKIQSRKKKKKKNVIVQSEAEEDIIESGPVSLYETSPFMQEGSFSKWRVNLSSDIDSKEKPQVIRLSTPDNISNSHILSQIVVNSFNPLQHTLYKFFQIDDIQVLKNQPSFIKDYSVSKEEVLWFKNCVFLQMFLPFSFGMRSGYDIKNDDATESDLYAYIFFSGVEPWFNRMSLLFANWYTDMCNNLDHLFEYVTCTTTAELLSTSHMMYFNTIYPEDETRANSIHNVFKYTPRLPKLISTKMRVQKDINKNRKYLDDRFALEMVEYDKELEKEIASLRNNTGKYMSNMIEPFIVKMRQTRDEYAVARREELARLVDLETVESTLKSKGVKFVEKEQKLVLTRTSQPASAYKITQITKNVLRYPGKTGPWGLVNGGKFFSDIRYSGQSMANVFVIKSVSLMLSRLNILLKSNKFNLSYVTFFEPGFSAPFLFRNLTQLLTRVSTEQVQSILSMDDEELKTYTKTRLSNRTYKSYADMEKALVDADLLPSMTLIKNNFALIVPEVKSIDIYGISPEYILETASIIIAIQRFFIDCSVPRMFAEVLLTALKQTKPEATYDDIFKNFDQNSTTTWVNYMRAYSQDRNMNNISNFDLCMAFAFHVFWTIYKEISLNDAPETYTYKKYGCAFDDNITQTVDPTRPRTEIKKEGGKKTSDESDVIINEIPDEDIENYPDYENPTIKLHKRRISNWTSACERLLTDSLDQILLISSLPLKVDSDTFMENIRIITKDLSNVIVIHLMKTPFDIFGLSLHNPIFHTDTLNSSLLSNDDSYQYPKQTTTSDGVYNVRVGEIRPSELYRTFGFYNKFDETRSSSEMLPCVADYSIFNVNTIGNRVLLDPNTFFTNTMKLKFFLTPLMQVFTQKTNALYKEYFKPEFRSFWHMAVHTFENGLASIRLKNKEALRKSQRKKVGKESQKQKPQKRISSADFKDYEYEIDEEEIVPESDDKNNDPELKKTGYLNRYILPEQFVPLIVFGHMNNTGMSILANFMTRRNSTWLYEGLILEDEVFSQNSQHYDKVNVVDPYAKLIGKSHVKTTFETKHFITDAGNEANLHIEPHQGTFLQDSTVIAKVKKHVQRTDYFLQMDYYDIKSTWQNNWPAIASFFQPDFDRENFTNYTKNRPVYYDRLNKIMTTHLKVNDLKLYKEVAFPLSANESRRWVDGVRRHPFFSNHLNRIDTFEKHIKSANTVSDQKQMYDLIVNDLRYPLPKGGYDQNNSDVDSGEYAVSTYDIDMTRTFWNGTKELIALGLGPNATRSHLLPVPSNDMATRYGFGESFVPHQWISGENFSKELENVPKLPKLPSFYATNVLQFGLERSLLYLKNFGKTRAMSEDCDIDLKLSAMQKKKNSGPSSKMVLESGNTAFAFASTSTNPLLRDILKDVVHDLDMGSDKNLLSVAMSYVEDQQEHYLSTKQIAPYIDIDTGSTKHRRENSGPYFVNALDKRTNDKQKYSLLASYPNPTKNSNGVSYTTAFGMYYSNSLFTSSYKLDQDDSYDLPFSHLTTITLDKDTPKDIPFDIAITDEQMQTRVRPNVETTMALLMSCHIADFSQKTKTKVAPMVADILQEPLYATTFYRIYSNYDMDAEYDVHTEVNDDNIEVSKVPVPLVKGFSRENGFGVDADSLVELEKELETIGVDFYFRKARLNVMKRKMDDFYIKNPWLISHIMVYDISRNNDFHSDGYKIYRYLPLQKKRLCKYTIPYYSPVVTQTNITPFFLSFDRDDDYDLFARNFYAVQSFVSNLSVNQEDYRNAITFEKDYKIQGDAHQRYMWLLMLQEGYDSLAQANTFFGKHTLNRKKKKKKNESDDFENDEYEIESEEEAQNEDDDISEISGSYGNIQFFDTAVATRPLYYNYPTKSRKKAVNIKRLSGVYLGSPLFRDILEELDQIELIDQYIIKDNTKISMPKTSYIDFGCKRPLDLGRYRQVPLGRLVNEMVAHTKSKGINHYRTSILCTKLGRKMYSSILLGKPLLYSPNNKLPPEYLQQIQYKETQIDNTYGRIGFVAIEQETKKRMELEIKKAGLTGSKKSKQDKDLKTGFEPAVYQKDSQNPVLSFESSPANKADVSRFIIHGVYHPINLLDQQKFECESYRSFALDTLLDSTRNKDFVVSKETENNRVDKNLNLAEDTKKSSQFIDDHRFLLEKISANLTLTDQLIHLLNFCDENGYQFSNNCFSNDLFSDVVQFANAVSCSLASESLLQTIAPNMNTSSKSHVPDQQKSFVSQKQHANNTSKFDLNGPSIAESIVQNLYVPNSKGFKVTTDVYANPTESYIKDDNEYLIAESNIFQSIFGFNIESHAIWACAEGQSTNKSCREYHRQKMINLIENWVLRQTNKSSRFTPYPIPFWSSTEKTTLHSLGTDIDYFNSTQLLDPSGLNVISSTKIGQLPKTSITNVEDHCTKIRRSLTKEAAKAIAWNDQHFKSLSLSMIVSDLEKCRHRDVLRVERQGITFTRQSVDEVAPSAQKNSNGVREICEINLDNLFSSMSQRSHCGDIEYRTVLDGLIGVDRNTFSHNTTQSESDNKELDFSHIKDTTIKMRKYDGNSKLGVETDENSVYYTMNTDIDVKKNNPDIYEPENIQFSDIPFNTSFYKDQVQHLRVESKDILKHVKYGDVMFNKGGSFRRVLMAAYVRFVYRLLDTKGMEKQDKELSYPQDQLVANCSDMLYKLITRPKTITNKLRDCNQSKKRHIYDTLYYKLRSYDLWRSGDDNFDKVLKQEFAKNLTSSICRGKPTLFTPYASKLYVPRQYPITISQLIQDPNYDRKLKEGRLQLARERKQRSEEKKKAFKEPTTTADITTLQNTTQEPVPLDENMEMEEEYTNSEGEIYETNQMTDNYNFDAEQPEETDQYLQYLYNVNNDNDDSPEKRISISSDDD